jgi:hypothetical protein
MVLLPVLSFGFVVAITGCVTSKGYTRATATTSRIDDVRTELELLKIQIDTTSGSVKGLLEGGDQDLRPLYASFVKQISRLEAGANRLDDRVARMREQGRDYYVAWDSEIDTISDPETREQSRARQDQARERFRELVSTVEEVKAVMEPYLTDLRDVQSFLNNDLNPSGVAAISDKALMAADEGETLKAHIDRVTAELEEVNAAISPVPVAVEEPPEPESKG